MTIAWDDNSDNETQFRIERSVSGGAFVEYATTAANVTSYTDNALSAGTTYAYRVRAYNGAFSAYSNTLSYTAPGTSTPTNTAPSIGSISNRSIPVNSSAGPITFSVSDKESADAALVVTATASNTALVPPASITLGGGGSSRAITVTPAINQTGNTTITLTVSDGDLSTSTSFVLTVSPASSGGGGGDPILIPPAINSHPVDQTVTAGASVTFTVTASGSPSPTYQWRKDGTPISGATSNLLTLSEVALSAAGAYDVLVSNSAGSVTSQPAVLTVKPAGIAPTITSHPATQTTQAGASVTFSVAATGSPAPTYQWRKDGFALAGATGSSLTLSNVQTSAAGVYDVVVTNPAGTATSQPAVLTVDLPSFVGTYTGKFDGKGMWTLHVRENRTASYIAHLTHLGAAFVVELAVEADGTLRVVSTRVVELGGGAAKASSLLTSGESKAKTKSLTLTGRIDGSSVTGSVLDLGVSFAGGMETTSGPAAAFAGFHSASDESGAEGAVYASVRATGETVIVISLGGTVDWLVGVTTPDGTVAGVTNAGGHFEASIAAGSLIVSATYMAPGSSVARQFVGIPLSARSKLVNASLRTTAGTDNNTLIAGFAVAGSATKPLLLRAVGPTLGAFGVAGTLADPTLTVYRDQSVAASNDDWASSGQDPINHASQRSGAFPLDPTSKDAVVLATIGAGTYSAHVSGKDASSGVSLFELYDADPTTDARLVNLSARCFVGSGNDVLILGFAIAGEGPRQLLIRGIGPTLGAFGVAGTIANPQLTLYSGSTVVDQNDDWGGNAAVQDAFAKTGAFPLDATARDAALLVTLQPGVYSVVLSGVADATGVALLELYEVP